MIQKLRAGIPNPGIGRHKVGEGITSHRDTSGARIYVKERRLIGEIEILGMSDKKKVNQNYVIARIGRLNGIKVHYDECDWASEGYQSPTSDSY